MSPAVPQPKTIDEPSEPPKTSEAPVPTPSNNAHAAALASLQAQLSKAQTRHEDLLAKRLTHARALLAIIEPVSTIAAAAPRDGVAEDQMTDDELVAHAKTIATQTTRKHIALLHKYNEIRDIAEGLMGILADARGVRVRDVMEEFGMVETEDDGKSKREGNK